MTLDDVAERVIDVLPLLEELLEYDLARFGQLVKTLVPLRVFTPLADEKPLGFEPAKQRVKRSFVDLNALFGEIFAERVSILLAAEVGKNGEDKSSSPEFHPQIFES
jgi:hypothetical protein